VPHFRQTEAPFIANSPAAHSEQVLAPIESENLPAVHRVHVAAMLHAALKPVPVSEEPDKNNILRKPVVDE
jgi:hypothetical protein